jgi:hypothetical protein
MSQLQFSLVDLRARQVPIQWHEAVAVVLEVAEWFERGVTRGVVPGLGDVSLTDEGRLLLRTTGPRTPEPVRALAKMLETLLEDTPAPEELRLLARQDEASNSVHVTVEEFSRALGFFARPDRATDLLMLAQRAILELERASAEQEMQRLRQKMERADGQAKPAPGFDLRPVLKWVAWSAAAAAISAAAWGGWTYRAQIGTEMDRATAAAVDRVVGLVATETPAPAAPGTQPAPAPRRPVSPRPPGGGSAPAGSPAVGGSPAPARGNPDASPGPAAEATAGGLGEVSSGASPAAGTGVESTAAAPAGSAVPAQAVYYTAEDADVVPAALVRPQFPTTPEGAGTEVEVVIDETGRVEAVRLVQFEDRYQNRMMVSAIKAWRFTPARRNGAPVKYKKRIRLQ